MESRELIAFLTLWSNAHAVFKATLIYLDSDISEMPSLFCVIKYTDKNLMVNEKLEICMIVLVVSASCEAARKRVVFPLEMEEILVSLVSY